MGAYLFPAVDAAFAQGSFEHKQHRKD